MQLIERFFSTITYVVSCFSFSDPSSFSNKQQSPLLDVSQHVHAPGKGPIFKPPTGRPVELPGGDLVCNYTRMGADWASCSTPHNRACWLKNKKTGVQYNITTDYEDPKLLPVGVDRYYTLDVTDGSINADGMDFTEGKFFWNVSDPESKKPENRYPGPWLQACWGDVCQISC
jgi:hypothetical protein